MVLGASACGPREQEPLIDLERWTVVNGEASDPFAAFQDGTCAPAAVGYELFGGDPSYGIDAMDCAFVTIEQPALAEVGEGDALHLRVWHFELEALAVTSATIAMAIDGRTVHELHLPIPGPSGLDAPYFEAPFDAPAGAPVHFHVRNHGRNSYALLEISVGGEIPEGP